MNTKTLQHIILSFFCCSFFIVSALTAEELRIGAISDLHLSFQSRKSNKVVGLDNLQKAFAKMKELGVDVVIINGDIANDGNPELISKAREAYDLAFPTQPPILIAVAGNHDFRWKEFSTVEEKQDAFMKAMKMESLDQHLVIGGYSFITLNPDHIRGEYYSDAAGERLAAEIRKAKERAPNQPIFCLAHYPSAKTVPGNGRGIFNKVLAPFPEVIHIASHVHYPLEDERCIQQKLYTTVITGTTLRCSLERGRINGYPTQAPPNMTDVSAMLYFQINSKEVKIRRFQLKNENEIKPESPWIIKLPLAKENFVYTDERIKARQEPYFPPNASLKAEVINNDVMLTVSAAKHHDFVHTYAIAISEKKNMDYIQQTELLFFSDFYRGLEKMADFCSVRITPKHFAFQENCDYRLDVYPVESFGLRGKEPVSTTLTFQERAIE